MVLTRGQSCVEKQYYKPPTGHQAKKKEKQKMAELKLDFPSMGDASGTRDNWDAPEADGQSAAQAMYPSMGESAEAFDAANFDQTAWSAADRAEVQRAREFLKDVDPDGSKFGKAWNREAGDPGGNRLGNSRLHVQAVARAAKRTDDLINTRFGPPRDGEKRLNFNMPNITRSERLALQREIEGYLRQELMKADAQYIQRSKRSLQA
jgi:hypothetical protein